MKKRILIKKSSGVKEIFSPNKLKQSLIRAGASNLVIKNIEKEIYKIIYPGISTKEIYKRAFSLLRKESAHMAAKYKLKKAILELGPSGYPFEKYVAAILSHKQYDAKVGQIVNGYCVQHEVDVIAEKDNFHFMIECKFHSNQSRKCDVKIPLYIYSRFLDVEKAWKLKKGHGDKFHQGWLITNTRFTSDAIKYGTCAGLHLVSWSFPPKESLKELIDNSGLHPVTCLTTLRKSEKQALLDLGIVLCLELCENEELLLKVGVGNSRREKVLEEGRLLCRTKIATN